MPLIQIELEEIEFLKRQITNKDEKITKLESELKNHNKEELKKLAILTAEKYFHGYLKKLFSKFDLEYQEPLFRPLFNELNHWLGEEAFNSDKLDIEIGVSISTLAKNAFVSLYIKDK